MSMPIAIIDGIATRYEVFGSGPPLLMYSPAGFDATLDKWRTQGVYAKINLLDHLPNKYTALCSTVANVASRVAASNA